MTNTTGLEVNVGFLIFIFLLILLIAHLIIRKQPTDYSEDDDIDVDDFINMN